MQGLKKTTSLTQAITKANELLENMSKEDMMCFAFDKLVEDLLTGDIICDTVNLDKRMIINEENS